MLYENICSKEHKIIMAKNMENKKQLKLISLRLGNSDTKKNLKSPIFYFYNEKKSLSEDFFKLSTVNKDVPKISISAVIGKNGSGKSALIDEVLRLINNFAYNNADSSKADLGLAGQTLDHTLHFKIGDMNYYLEQKGSPSSPVKLYRGSIRDKDEITKNKDKNFLSENFFYTVLVNYSIYAFNTREYAVEMGFKDKENRYNHWLNGVFHKNDGYKAPLVLNPMRTEGNFNINTENDLAKDRLISLFIEGSLSAVNTKNIFTSLIIAPPFKWNLLKDKIERKWGLPKFNVVELNKDNIIRGWEKRKGVSFKRQDINPKLAKCALDKAPYEIACDYLAYKTFASVWQYGENALKGKGIPSQILNPSSVEPISQEDLDSLIAILDEENSHITLKLRQTLAFLILNHYQVDRSPYGNPPRKENNPKYSAEMLEWAQYTDHLSQHDLILQQALIEKIKANKEIIEKNHWLPIDLCPAPCFSKEVILTEKSDGVIEEDKKIKEYPITKLSSGERQQIYTISTVLYHLRNLNSIQDQTRTRYHHVNLILDEIELYFHPDLQRNFVYELLYAIYALRLDSIYSINIMLITHSPFILSDIPKENTLFLKKGEMDTKINETFGANIADLLKEGFFLDKGFLGEFAAKKINDVICSIQNGPINSQEEYKKYLSFITLVGEPLIKDKLLNMLDEAYYKDNAHKVLENRKMRLKEELDSIEIKLGKHK